MSTRRRAPAPVLIGDPDARSRAVLRGTLERTGYSIEEAATGYEVLASGRAQRPALVVLDVSLAGPVAYEVCRDLRDQFGEGLPIVLLSAERLEPVDEIAALLLGADDYIAKPLAVDQFLARIRRLLQRSGELSDGSHLTPREREVLTLLVEGVRPVDIAERLAITPKTTATHIERILAKLGAHSQAQAVAFAVRDRIIAAPRHQPIV
jgi:DNA-binding NarL/FixJ family response regulator